MMKSQVIKLPLAILVLLCLLNMFYGFFEFVRFLALVGFGVLAYNAHEEKKTQVIIYVALALLLQPFFKIALGRMRWNIIDVIVAI